MSQKQVMPKSEDLSRSLEINAIWTFDTEFPTIFNKLFYFINWGGWRCWWTDFVPDAIHNPVAIELLVSGLLT